MDRKGQGRPQDSLYGEVTARIIAELEQGRVPWVQPWDDAACGCTRPENGATAAVTPVSTC